MASSRGILNIQSLNELTSEKHHLSLCAGAYPHGAPARPPRRERVGGRKMLGSQKRRTLYFFCGEKRIGISGPDPPF
jgi:hypothetical protein